MENFLYNIPTKVYFGKGEESRIGEILSSYHPHKVMIHYGQGSVIKSGLLDLVKSKLDEVGISYCLFGGVKPNPELSLVKEGIELGKKEKVDFILAIGGGSVMDSAKDIANGIANPEDDVWEYSTYVKKPAKTLQKGAILTISASGSEMSDSCVISNGKMKKGYCSDLNRFDFAIENPELTYSVSPYQTACGIVDIAMHTIERYFDLGESSLTDDISLALIKNVFAWGKVAMTKPNDYEARANLMWASSLAHNGLTHKGKDFLLTVHQLEHSLSGLYPSVAHGAGLAALWCSWARKSYKSNIERWKRYALFVWDVDFTKYSNEEGIELAISKQENYYREINMPISIKDFGVKKDDLVELSLLTSANKSKIIRGYYPLGYDEILEIFSMSFERN